MLGEVSLLCAATTLAFSRKDKRKAREFSSDASDKALSSAKVCPVPLNSVSDWLGSKVALKNGPLLSRKAWVVDIHARSARQQLLAFPQDFHLLGRDEG